MNFFENTDVHEHTSKLYNSKLHEWISYMPDIYQSLAMIITLPEFSMKTLEASLKTNTPTNRHLFIVAILSYLRNKRHTLVHLTQEQYASLRVQWIDINSANEAPLIQRRMENKPTDMQLKKSGVHLTFDDLVAKRNQLTLGTPERLLIAMYTMIPPVRADYFATEIVHHDEVPTEKNYIRIRDNTAECILTDFKTVKQYKQITHTFPPELVTELLASLEKTPRAYLFLNANGKPHTRNSFTIWTRRALTRILENEFTLVFFRHAYVSNFITTNNMSTMTDAEMKSISDKMGHSPEMFRAYKWVHQGKQGELNLEDVSDE
jgi:hypothetical protein